VHLPGNWSDRIGRLVDRHGEDPERVAADILRAVRAKRTLLTPGARWMLPLWKLKRLSEPLYHALAHLFSSRAAKT
jgi:hypothetical protein